MNKVPMTVRGFDALKEELRWRQQEERPRIIEAIAEARSHGDLSENAEYHAAKESQSLNEGRVNELEDLIARAEVIDVGKLTGDRVKFGADMDMQQELRDVFDACNRNNTSIYALDPRGLSAGEFDTSTNISMRTSQEYLNSSLDTLRELAEQTDGLNGGGE